MERQTIPAGWLTLRPFTAADIPWVYEVSLDPAVQHFVGVPTPYRMEHAAFFVQQMAIAGWDSGQRAEFLAHDTATGTRLGRVGLGLRASRDAEIGYWIDPRPRRRGVATAAVRAICRWAFVALDLELIEWRCEVGNIALATANWLTGEGRPAPADRSRGRPASAGRPAHGGRLASDGRPASDRSAVSGE